MTTYDQIRLAALEIYYAEGEITQRELAELEALRDQAGQGWLLDPGSQERSTEAIPDPGAELARRLAQPLHGHDRGEQSDLFGQGLLL
jgi:hypothetical protein